MKRHTDIRVILVEMCPRDRYQMAVVTLSCGHSVRARFGSLPSVGARCLCIECMGEQP